VRGLRLARIAAQAELLYLRRLARRQGVRLAFALAASVFLLAALAVLHVAAVLALNGPLTPLHAVLIVAAADLAVGVVLALLAARDRPDAVEREAIALRDAACGQIKQAAAMAALTAAVVRLLRRRG
jgi:hypothetical protein